MSTPHITSSGGIAGTRSPRGARRRIVDPPDGRIPPLTADGRQRAAEVAEAGRRVPRGPEDRNLAERCLTRGAPKLPGGYNNNFHLLQAPGYVAILQEMIHEVRIIPLDGRPHLPGNVQQWMGDSRGHWEGDTLVVDTTNYHDKVAFNSYNCCPGAGRNLHIVERYRRVSADTVDFQFTVDDPTTFTKPFTIALPMTRTNGPLTSTRATKGMTAWPASSAALARWRTARRASLTQSRVERAGERQPPASPKPRPVPSRSCERMSTRSQSRRRRRRRPSRLLDVGAVENHVLRARIEMSVRILNLE